MFYSVTNILVARPGTDETGDPLVPFLVMGGAFGFTVAAMLVPLVSEFDVALGRTSGGRIDPSRCLRAARPLLPGIREDSMACGPFSVLIGIIIHQAGEGAMVANRHGQAACVR